MIAHDTDRVAGRICPVIFLLDTSRSMNRSMNAEGEAPIHAVNTAMKKLLPELAQINEDSTDLHFMTGILTFDSAAEWLTGPDFRTPGLADPADYVWHDLKPFGGTCLGQAFDKVNRAFSAEGGLLRGDDLPEPGLSSDGRMISGGSSASDAAPAVSFAAPMFFLLSDGDPTESYADSLLDLRNNPWFKKAGRAAIGFDRSSYESDNKSGNGSGHGAGYGPGHASDDAGDAVLREFTGNAATVLHAGNAADLKNMIRFIILAFSAAAAGPASSAGKGARNAAEDQDPEGNNALRKTDTSGNPSGTGSDSAARDTFLREDDRQASDRSGHSRRSDYSDHSDQSGHSGYADDSDPSGHFEMDPEDLTDAVAEALRRAPSAASAYTDPDDEW